MVSSSANATPSGPRPRPPTHAAAGYDPARRRKNALASPGTRRRPSASPGPRGLMPSYAAALAVCAPFTSTGVAASSLEHLDQGRDAADATHRHPPPAGLAGAGCPRLQRHLDRVEAAEEQARPQRGGPAQPRSIPRSQPAASRAANESVPGAFTLRVCGRVEHSYSLGALCPGCGGGVNGCRRSQVLDDRIASSMRVCR